MAQPHQFLQKAPFNPLHFFGDCSTGYGYSLTANARQRHITLCKPQNLILWENFYSHLLCS